MNWLVYNFKFQAGGRAPADDNPPDTDARLIRLKDLAPSDGSNNGNGGTGLDWTKPKPLKPFQLEERLKMLIIKATGETGKGLLD
ncbi:uncharacterized protein N7483_013013 [Penicillium malachiteum]|uniref:uncharacterized protein n=1 Tax=Penicillium malachiteum TaxID=1324776 RepID=UPI002546A803|nr:uncharacterized protein N7483_013013 [Penicillium malachiteum]KAJ5715832.1 hypothetical protein N7483_013013 [Penicillium malachiteum]